MIKYIDLQHLREVETEKDSGTIRVFFAKHGPCIDSPHLLVRAINGLERIHIKTMDELENTSPDELARIRNIGAKSLCLILNLCEQYIKNNRRP